MYHTVLKPTTHGFHQVTSICMCNNQYLSLPYIIFCNPVHVCVTDHFLERGHSTRMRSEFQNELNENKVQFARIGDKNVNFFLLSQTRISFSSCHPPQYLSLPFIMFFNPAHVCVTINARTYYLSCFSI